MLLAPAIRSALGQTAPRTLTPASHAVFLAAAAVALILAGARLAVPIVRRTLNRYAMRLGLDEDRPYALITAVGEAMANAVEHAYPERPGIVRLRVANGGGALHVTIEDDGRWKQAQKREERGRGLPLMRALMDGVEIRTNQSHTTISLTMAWSK